MAEPKKYELKNGETKWMFSVYTGINPKTGKQSYTDRRGFKTKGEANKALRRIEADVAAGTYYKQKKVKSDYTYKDVYELWLPEYEHTVGESTYFKTTDLFNDRILVEIGDYKIDKITHEDIQKLANKWGHYYSCSKWISTIRRIFKYARAHNIITSDPSELVVVPTPKVEKREKLFYETSELKKFVEELDKDENLQKQAFLRLLIFCGLRRGEALGLYWDCIDFNKKTIRIKRALRTRKNKGGTNKAKSELYIGDPKNKASFRTISVDEKTLTVLKELKKYKINERVFNAETGNYLSPSKPRKWLLSTSKRSGVESIHVHGLRHTHASLLIESGATVKEVQKRLGHGDIETTLQIYVHVTEQSEENLAGRFSDYINF